MSNPILNRSIGPRLLRVSLITLLVYLIYINFIKEATPNNSITFEVNSLPDLDGRSVGLRGSQYPLSWDKSITMNIGDDAYRTKISFPDSIVNLEFKFVLDNSDNEIEWESIDNRFLDLSNINSNVLTFSWNIEQNIDVSGLPSIDKEALNKDYALIEEMVLNTHPGTFRYNDINSIQQELDTLKAKMAGPLSIGEAYLNMSRMTASIKCDHTKVGFNNQQRNVNAVIHRQPDKLPFTFRWYQDYMLVTYDATEKNLLPKGSQISKINDISVIEIRKKMLRYVAADGSTDHNRLAKLEIDGYDFRYNAFDVFYPLLFPVINGSVILEVLLNDEVDRKIIEANTLTREDRSNLLKERYPAFPATRDDMWDFRIDEDNIGVLTLNSFGLMGWKRMTIDYKQFLEGVFSELRLKDINRLIIDIRKNTGGNDEIKHELYNYLNWDREISKISIRDSRSRYKEFPQSLKPFIQSWGDDPWYFALNPDEYNNDSGYYIFNQRKETLPLQIKENVFRGQVVLLTGALNTSLAYYTAADFKRYKIGKIIGEETGGNLRGINGGQILFLRLPGSGIEIDFPIIGGFTFNNQADSGVVPDIIVNPSRSDLLLDTDRTMEKAKVYLIEN